MGSNVSVKSARTEIIKDTINAVFYKKAVIKNEYTQLTLVCKGDYGIDAGMVLPQVCELFVAKQRDVRVGQSFAQALERRSGHDRIPEPIHAAD